MISINPIITKNPDPVEIGTSLLSVKPRKPKLPGSLNVAIVHDWLVNYAGAEKCVESFTNIFPEADAFTLVDFLDDTERKIILKGKSSKTSFIQQLPFSRSKFRYYLPFFPSAVEQFDLRDYNLIISSSHAVAKGVLTNTYQLHICYCHTPMRYAWNNYYQYLDVAKLKSGIKAMLAARALQRLRSWDYETANRPDFFIANSFHIAKQIKKRYNREAAVIYPPVDTQKFKADSNKDDYYLTVSRMVPNKRIDLIIDAFSKLKDRKLIVIGDGPLKKQLKKIAGSNIEFIQPQSFEILTKYMEKARAFVSAAEEDFGITVVEAMAAGTPVIAFSRGGTGESVIDNKTGILFHNQTTDSLIEGIYKFEKMIDLFDIHFIKKYSDKFSRNNFEMKIKEFIAEKMIEFNF